VTERNDEVPVPRLALGIGSAAKAVDLGVDTITAAIKSGRLRAKRSGPKDKDGNPTGKHLITIEALREWLDQLEDA
jgi:hypothetical protein